MIDRLIEFSLRNRFLVIAFYLGIAGWGYFALTQSPVDAIPDLSDNQVIVFTDWTGRSPQEVEDQVTYPLTTSLQGLPGVRVVRSSSAFGFSMIFVIFEDNVDLYFARTRVLERLNLVSKQMPPGVVPTLGPDATGVGHVFWYTVEGGGRDLRELPIAQVLSRDLAEAQTAFVGFEAELEVEHKKLERTQELVRIGAASREELERVDADHRFMRHTCRKRGRN